MQLDHRAPRVGLTGCQTMNLVKHNELEKTVTLLDKNNHNLTHQQKELMLWHQRLGHAGFRWIQGLMRRPKHEAGNNEEPPVIPTRLVSAHNCDLPQCPACRLSKAHRRSPGSQRIRARPEFEMSIRREDLQPGDCISMDQCQARAPGRLPTAHGREPTQTECIGGACLLYTSDAADD